MIDDFHILEPYSLVREEKHRLLLKELKCLTETHRCNCKEYANYLDAIGFCSDKVTAIEDIPYLPIRAFKELELKSISDDDVFKIMTSSGTSGQKKSRIFLNKENAILQQKVLLRLIGDFVGKKRLPMLVIDSRTVIKDRRLFTTRGATIMGLDFAARKMIFALRDDMSLDIETITNFVENYGNEPFIIFGFTFMVWQHLFKELDRKKQKVDLSKGYLLTAGGWKKLVSEAVSNEEFKRYGASVCGLTKYVDHYGMAEQTGSIYAECEYGHLHASIYSDVIVRRFEDFSVCGHNEPGFIQLVSALPRSYPGHSLLTEDEGMILGEDDCPCGRKGKYIKVLGRISKAEIRGCSDTYAADFV